MRPALSVRVALCSTFVAEVEANRIVIDGDPVFAASGESDIEMLRLRKHRTVRFSDVERRRGGGNFC